jgi:hypothetical protein
VLLDRILLVFRQILSPNPCPSLAAEQVHMWASGDQVGVQVDWIIDFRRTLCRTS